MPETETIRLLSVQNKMGIHARPAAMIVRISNKYPSTELWVEKDGEEVKREESTQYVNHADVESQSIGSKDSMVAEPQFRYQSTPPYIRPAYRPPGL